MSGTDQFTPCLITVQRDPNVIGRERKECVIHRWNRSLDHVRRDLVRSVSEVPVPLGTVKQMESFTDDFYRRSVPRFCDECFPEQSPETDTDQ